MAKNMVFVLAISIFLISTIPPVYAGELGDQAYPLEIAKWIKGGPVDLSKTDTKNIYVIEFWATWCPPCRQTIPHLTELQKKYKDKGVIIVGISDEEVATVEKFVEEMKDQMDYIVAVDSERKTSQAYYEAFGITSIPHAFLIDTEGKIAWHGHPGQLDFFLEALISGTYKIEVQKALQKWQEKAAEYLATVKESEVNEEGQPIGKITEDAKQRAEKIAEDLYKGLEAIEDCVNAATIFNDVAWYMMTDEEALLRDMKLALKIATIANKLTEGKNWYILDTYAYALFENGKILEAVQYQKEAIKYCQNDEQKSEFEKRLEKYEEAAKSLNIKDEPDKQEAKPPESPKPEEPKKEEPKKEEPKKEQPDSDKA